MPEVVRVDPEVRVPRRVVRQPEGRSRLRRTAHVQPFPVDAVAVDDLVGVVDTLDVTGVIGILILAEGKRSVSRQRGADLHFEASFCPEVAGSDAGDDVVRERSSAIIVEAHRARVVCDVGVEGRHTSAQPGKAYEVGGFCREDLFALGGLDVAIACTR